jgi:hypothetical protein
MAENRIPIERAAQELGTTVLAVLMHIKRKRLEGVEIDGAWYVTAESLAAFRPEAPGAATICRGHCAGHGGCSGKG